MVMSLESPIEIALGQEFLTWLWFRSEALNGTYHTVADQKPYSLYVQQRIVVRGGEGEQVETASVSGVHSALREAKLGLTTGKFVVRALVQLEVEEAIYSTTLKAEDFCLNSLRTPAISKEDKEDTDPDAQFLEKMYFLEEALSYIDDVYLQFLQIRLDNPRWAEECRAIGDWINS